MQAGSSIYLLLGVYYEFQSGISLWFNVCDELLCSLLLTVIRAMYCVRELVGVIHKGQLGCIIIPFVVQMVTEFTQGTIGVNISFIFQMVIEFTQGAIGVNIPFLVQLVIQFTQGAVGVHTIHISDGHRIYSRSNWGEYTIHSSIGN